MYLGLSTSMLIRLTLPHISSDKWVYFSICTHGSSGRDSADGVHLMKCFDKLLQFTVFHRHGLQARRALDCPEWRHCPVGGGFPACSRGGMLPQPPPALCAWQGKQPVSSPPSLLWCANHQRFQRRGEEKQSPASCTPPLLHSPSCCVHSPGHGRQCWLHLAW